MNIDRAGFIEYMSTLSRVSGVQCLNIADVLKALEIRLDYFHANGARVSDHALDTVPYVKCDEAAADAALKKGLAGEELTQAEVDAYKTYLLVKLGGMYKARGWVQQYHIGAMRNNNPRMFAKYGADVGFDSIDDTCIAQNLTRLMADQEREDKLPKTILYGLNP